VLAFYRALLRLYPAAYRDEYGDEMADVLEEVQAENRRKGVLELFFSRAHETGGLVFGAVREHFYSLTGSYDSGWFSFSRGFAMRSDFRFPKATVGLMTVILAAVMFTIEKAKAISASIPHANPPVGPIQSAQATIVETLLLALVWAIAAGAVGWGILHAFHRSGTHRLSEVHPGGTRRSGSGLT
jgi:hypothetical protein